MSQMQKRILEHAAKSRSKTIGTKEERKIEMNTLPGLSGKFATVLADPPWRFANRTGKVAPEHRRLRRYETMTVDEICALPISAHIEDRSHLYLWVPNALLREGLQVMEAWGFNYKTTLTWYKIR